ncbi:MAG: arginase family protein, partial [Phycisphaerales bacterium]|nr:arginase family protein [Phycisphaerales bacterium]
MPFDPNAAATDPHAVFGLPYSREDASVVLIGIPYDATSSYGVGSARAPEAIREASIQVDLFDRRFGAVHERGIHMEPHPEEIESWSKQARLLSAPIIEQGGPGQGDDDAVSRVDQFSARATNHARDRARAAYADDKIPGVIGGEHGVAFGLYKAAAEQHPGLGILQIDAHMDLRPAYEGFAWSHASVMHNVLHDLDGVARIVQVGIRDYCEQEAALAEEHAADRVAEGQTSISTFFWDDLADEGTGGGFWGVICERIITRLPANIVISVDID